MPSYVDEMIHDSCTADARSDEATTLSRTRGQHHVGSPWQMLVSRGCGRGGGVSNESTGSEQPGSVSKGCALLLTPDIED